MAGRRMRRARARDREDRILAAQPASGSATEFDQAMAGLAASLIRVPADAIDGQIVGVLGAVGEMLGADRASVVQHAPAEHLLVRTHRWVRAGTPGPPPSDPDDAFPWLFAGSTSCPPRPPATARCSSATGSSPAPWRRW
jgi:hypothetical protein